MNITGMTLDGLDLMGADYAFTPPRIFDYEKIVVTNDLFGDGQAFGRSKNNSKTLVLNGNILSGDVNKITALNQMLAANGLKELAVNVQGIGWITSDVEMSNRIEGDTTRIISAQLIMPDPCWLSQTAATLTLGSTSSAALVLPFTLPFTLGGLTGGAGTITNGGNIDAYPVITIIGTCDTLTISNTTTGESISINVSLGASDTLIIDCNPASRSVTLNGVNSISLKTTAGWITCIPGDNTITFARNSLEEIQHCSVALQSRWI